MTEKNVTALSRYQKLIIFLLAITQFTVILDFMVMSPLGDMMMKSLNLAPSQFATAVSAYAFSAGIAGLLTAGFADRFDRKKLLLFFYSGFIVGSIFCGLAHSYPALVAARIVTGLFGGVIGSISMAIITDIFALQQRGRVMGFVQMGFGASQVLGVPIGLYIANTWGWESPFLMVAGLAVVIGLLIVFGMRPIIAHLAMQSDRSAFGHLWHTFAKRNYRIGFAATALLSIGGFMMMPFGTPFLINNIHISTRQLPELYMIAGFSSLIIMPLIGRLADRMDKFLLFAIATVWMMVVVVLYTNLGVTPFWVVIIFNIVMMMGIMSRMIPSTALVSAVPEMKDRGAFMSINASFQQIAGGIAAAAAGAIVHQKTPSSPLESYNVVGYTICGISVVAMILLSRVDRMTKKKIALTREVKKDEEIVAELAG